MKKKDIHRLLITGYVFVPVLIIASFFAGAAWQKYTLSPQKQNEFTEKLLLKVPFDLSIDDMKLQSIESLTTNCKLMNFEGDNSGFLYVTVCPKEIPKKEISEAENFAYGGQPLESRNYLYFFLQNNVDFNTAKERIWKLASFIESP